MNTNKRNYLIYKNWFSYKYGSILDSIGCSQLTKYFSYKNSIYYFKGIILDENCYLVKMFKEPEIDYQDGLYTLDSIVNDLNTSLVVFFDSYNNLLILDRKTFGEIIPKYIK